MEYTMELSLNLHKCGKYTDTKNMLNDLAIENDATGIYDFFEIEGGKRIQRNHCIFVVSFYKAEHCLNFLRLVRKLRNLHLETIYDSLCRISYASSYYRQNKMTKEGRILYKKRERNAFDKEIRNHL